MQNRTGKLQKSKGTGVLLFDDSFSCASDNNGTGKPVPHKKATPPSPCFFINFFEMLIDKELAV